MSADEVNRRIVLAARPEGLPKTSDFRLEETPLNEPGPGQILVSTRFLSVDPYMRGRMNAGTTYVPGHELGDVVGGGVVGDVIATRHHGWKEGDVAQAHYGWQTHGAVPGDEARKVDPDLAPVSTALGVLGMPGLTAYFGLLDVGRPEPGQTVLVSGAAGAVGSLVGQLAKIHQCRAVGSAGSQEKIAWIGDQLGFDGAFDYKATDDYGAELRRLCPDGVDVYFDNVGGPVSDAAFGVLNQGARISVCGQISQYNATSPAQGPRLTWHFIVKRLSMRGFLVFDYAERYREGLEALAGWVADGRLLWREDVVEGFEQTPSAFIGMLQGDNIGKRLVRVA